MLKQFSGQIPVTGIRKDNYNSLSFIFFTFGDLNSGIQSGS